MESEQNIIRNERAVLKEKYGKLFFAIAALLFEFDPIGVNFEDNNDEYEPEVGTILPRLPSANSAQDVEKIVYEEFCKWFGVDEVGPQSQYGEIAEKIWETWCEFSQQPT